MHERERTREEKPRRSGLGTFFPRLHPPPSEPSPELNSRARRGSLQALFFAPQRQPPSLRFLAPLLLPPTTTISRVPAPKMAGIAAVFCRREVPARDSSRKFSVFLPSDAPPPGDARAIYKRVARAERRRSPGGNIFRRRGGCNARSRKGGRRSLA